ncbi:unnamed protein product [Phytomonas sp. EM1]|nr:unnamed protein product [Phytomonas sp. EM1]|eukprot:CCW61651.1 unnamed protein product [Phytomonas sp. isolate EM1]
MCVAYAIKWEAPFSIHQPASFELNNKNDTHEVKVDGESLSYSCSFLAYKLVNFVCLFISAVESWFVLLFSLWIAHRVTNHQATARSAPFGLLTIFFF